VSLADGVGLGHVVLHEPRVVVKNLIAENVDAEVKRLDKAIGEVRASIDELIERGDVAHHGEHREVLETFRMFAHDQGWLRRMREAVLSGLTAEAAVERVQSDNRARMLRQTDPYLRERLHDLDDLANRLLHALVGRNMVTERALLPENAIIVARTMGPAALLDYDRSRLRGLVLEEAGPTSHIAIVARALGIPAVGEVQNATSLVEPGDAIIVDGGAGEVQVRPRPDVEAAYAEKARLRARRQEQYRRLRDVPAITRDGIEVTLQLNAGLLVDLPHLQETGAAGVGLFRTELQFMVAERMPTASEQQALYRTVFQAAEGLPITFRTLDIGGDKILPYMQSIEEENPALGWRAIRIGLDRPALLRAQVRALLKAAAGQPLKIMFPMIATCNEFARAKAVVEREKTYLARHGHPLPAELKLGVMLEVPSLLFQIEEICRAADFISVRSNDLMQFLFAVDRENRMVANRFDPLSAPSLPRLEADHRSGDAPRLPRDRVRRDRRQAARGHGPHRARLPFAVMSAAAIGPVKAMILGLDAGRIAQMIHQELACDGSGETLRPKLARYAEQHGIPI
jgi:phosphotransferase system enzyme I (PtsP)